MKWLIAVDEAHLLLIGLENSGKTLFLEQVKGAFNRAHKPAPANAIPPTRGMNLFKAGVFDMSVTIWDVGGAMRDMWAQYYADADALVFCVDAADRARFGEASAALADALMHTRGPVLVLANKQDVPSAARASEIQEAVCTPAGLPPGGSSSSGSSGSSGGGGERIARIIEISALQSAADGSARAAIEWVVGMIPRS